MSISYDAFSGAFLSKITEYDLLEMYEEDRIAMVDGFLKRSVSSFSKVCEYDLLTTQNDETREFEVEIEPEHIDEIIEIVSEGMVVQWLKPYVYRQELLESTLNTRDFTTYSPAELLYRIRDAYKQSQKEVVQMTREYSYCHGDLTRLHI